MALNVIGNEVSRVLDKQLLQFSKYSRTGDIKHINTLVLTIGELREQLQIAIQAGFEAGFEMGVEGRRKR